MLNNKKIAVVFPAYNASKTLVKTYNEVLEQKIVDYIVLVDDRSSDNTVEVAKTLPDIIIVQHNNNRGYGGNQKTCYKTALELGADIVVMVHPDYQYTPKLITALASIIAYEVYPCSLGSRILGGGTFEGGMPLWRFISNRSLTLFQNLLLNKRLSEYHTGYRAFSSKILKDAPLEDFDDDFIFDNQMLIWIIAKGYGIGEVTCPTKYFPEASSISFKRSLKYGIGCVVNTIKHCILKNNVTNI
jgi:glycosyltransferase involved in cell wall biosynthesis